MIMALNLCGVVDAYDMTSSELSRQVGTQGMLALNDSVGIRNPGEGGGWIGVAALPLII